MVVKIKAKKRTLNRLSRLASSLTVVTFGTVVLALNFFSPVNLPQIEPFRNIPAIEVNISLSESAPVTAGEDNTPASANEENELIYPLEALNLSSATEAYLRGFKQRAEPVPLDRWDATSNTTCVPHNDSFLNSLPEWKRRIPHAIIIGAQKGGSTAIHSYLANHSSVQRLHRKELHYFDEDLDQDPTILVNGSGIPATKALNQLQQIVIGRKDFRVKFELERKYAIDATPNYMWWSDRVPHRILCITPWVKLLAVLRNPVDRAYSQYHMHLDRHLSKPSLRRSYVSFEEYIALDMKVLQDTGVLPTAYDDWNKQDDSRPVTDLSFLRSNETMRAWAAYTKLGLNSPVGQGLYAFHLRHWLEVMDRYGKPRSDLKVVSSEHLLQFPNETYHEILRFFQLPTHSMASYGRVHATRYRAKKMAPDTRAKLQAFFAPFNRQLSELLKSNVWKKLWT